MNYASTAQQPLVQTRGAEIDLHALISIIWQGKWTIVAVTTVFMVVAVLYSLWMPNIYKAQALLSPSEDAQGGGISRMAGQLGGLATLAGINVNAGAGVDKVSVAMAVMQSRSFATSIVEEHNMLPTLMAVKSWERQLNQLIFDKDVYLAEENEWVRTVKPPRKPQPSEWEAYEKLSEIMTVVQDKKTGFISISVEHKSPYVAQSWVQIMIDEINQVMKEKDVEEARRSIDYLESQLQVVALAEMRSVFYQLIEEQTKTVMLAEARDEYIFSVIDPPVVPEIKSRPRRALICILGTFLGVTFAVGLVLLKYVFRKFKEERH